MSDMEYVKLGNIAKFRYGKMPDKDKFLDDGYPVFSGYRITGYYREYMVENPTLIVVARGVGGTGDVKISPPKSYITNLSIIVDLDESVADMRYLYYQFVCNNLRYLDTGAAQSQITINNLSKHKALLPRLVIQKKISSILTNYDNLIENNNKRIKLLEQMAENLYKEWFVRFRFPGYECVTFNAKIPSGWQYQTILELMDFYNSQRIPLSSMQRDKMDKIYPYYGAAKLMDYVDDYLFDGEYLLLGEDGTVITPDGFPVLQMINGKFWVNNHAHVISGKGNLSTRFLYLTFLRFPITGVVTGSAQPKISKGRLEKLKILVPDEKTIEGFNALINPIFDEINLLKTQLLLLTKQRDLLLPRLMSGKLEV